MKWHLILTGSILLAVGDLSGQENHNPLQKLATEIQQIIDAQPASKPAERSSSRLETARAALGHFRNAMARNDSRELESRLEQLLVYLDSESLRTQCEELVAQMRTARELAELKKLEGITAALKNAGEVIHRAKAAVELDPVLAQLGSLREERSGLQPSPAVSNALTKVESAVQFVTRWQDYLAALDSGDTQRGREALESLSNADRSTSLFLIPRSEILGRMTDPEGLAMERGHWFEIEAEKILTGIHTLEDLGGAVEELGKLEIKRGSVGGGDFYASLDSALIVFGSLDRTYRDFKAGLPTDVEFLSRALAGNRPGLSLYVRRAVPIYAELLKLVLPRYLSLPPEVKAKPDEGPTEFLDRVTAEAVAKEDILLAAQASETRRYLQTGNKDAQLSAVATNFSAARKQEQAGQFALAVTSYQRVLASGAELVPAKLIGERLTAIKAEHPQEFQQGLAQFLSPPVPKDPRFGYPLNGPPGRPMPPGMQPPNQPPARPVLTIPAAPAPASTQTPIVPGSTPSVP